MRPIEGKGIGPADGPVVDTQAAYQQLEAAFLRQMLSASGAFKPSEVAGGQIRADMFIEALADAVAKGGGIGIARMMQESIGDGGGAGAAAPAIGRVDGGDATGDVLPADVLSEAEAADRPSGFSSVPPKGITRRFDVGTHPINHPGGGLTTLDAHPSQVRAPTGQKVTGPQARLDDRQVDPAQYAGVAHRALNAYLKRAEDTVARTQGPRGGDGP